MPQVVGQERNRNHQTSASPGPITDRSRTSLDPQTPAQPIALLNVGGTAAGQSEGIEGPNSASIPSVIEVHDLEVINPGNIPRLLALGPE